MLRRTYTSMSLRPLAFLDDAVNLYRVRTRNIAAQAKATAAGARMSAHTFRFCATMGQCGYGYASISTHIYAAENGCHDLRIFAGERASIPYWAHLRPDCSHTVREACYMNKWRLGAWEATFTDAFPGATFTLQPHHDEHDQLLRAELLRLRSTGELSDYDDRELLIVNLITRWQKSSAARNVLSRATL